MGRQVLGELVYHLLAIVCSSLPALFDLNDAAPDLPVAGGHNDVHRTGRDTARRLKQLDDFDQSGRIACQLALSLNERTLL